MKSMGKSWFQYMGAIARRLSLRRNPSADLVGFWEDRARRYGRRAVLNLGYEDVEYDSVTAAQKNELFPLLDKMLTGDEQLVLDFGCGAGRFSAALSTLVGAKVVGVDPVRDSSTRSGLGH